MRKPRKNECTCYCGAYPFPHREMGGRCGGWLHVERAWGTRRCATCIHNAGTECQVLEGLEPAVKCEALAEHLADPPRRVWKGVDQHGNSR